MNSFAMVEDNSEFQSFEILQNEAFLLGFFVNSFTMVEEYFEFQSFEIVQIDGFSLGSERTLSRITSTLWVYLCDSHTRIPSVRTYVPIFFTPLELA